MQLRLLGTGGADGIPAFYGNDRVSLHARSHGGKEIRTRAAALVGSSLKIDFGPDTLHQLHRHGVNARDWTALLITHSDADHLCLSELQYCLFPFVECEHLGFTIYANQTVCQMIREYYPDWPIDIVSVKPEQKYVHAEYEFIPVLANHKPDEECFNFLIHRDGKSLLYATDTGVYSERTFNFLTGRQIDAIVIEASDGKNKTPYTGHMDLAQCLEVIERLRADRALHEDCQVITTHHTSAGDVTHAELEAILSAYRISPGFDGMVVEI